MQDILEGHLEICQHWRCLQLGTRLTNVIFVPKTMGKTVNVWMNVHLKEDLYGMQIYTVSSLMASEDHSASIFCICGTGERGFRICSDM